MRKADYALLAALISAKIRESDRQISEHEGELIDCVLWRARKHAVQEIACDFVASASVDKAQFLKACGIE